MQGKKLMEKLMVVVATVFLLGLLASPASADVLCNSQTSLGVIGANAVVNDNVLVTQADGTCFIIRGDTVKGNVKVSAGARVAIGGIATAGTPSGDRYGAGTDLIGGTIEGNIESASATVILSGGSTVFGNVISDGLGGEVRFPQGLPEQGEPGATVYGNVEMKGTGLLTAPNKGQDNLVHGDIKCEAPAPNNDPHPGGFPRTATDWDGDGTVDGSLGGNFECTP